MRMLVASDDDRMKIRTIFRWQWTALVLVAMSVATVVSVAQSPRSSPTKSFVSFSCPTSSDNMATVNKDESWLKTRYGNATSSMMKTNVSEFLESFRSSGFDDWGHSYEKVKKGMHHWKKTHFPPNLNDGDSIYESACGIGLNLYMTLEILKEEKGLESLIVYGNEYLQESADKANILFDRVPPFQSIKGTICKGDSTHLEFVPSNSFDLVYTGYISPPTDPLSLGKSVDENLKIVEQLCKFENGDWKAQKLSEMAQKVVNDFYGTWVSEMVRIAKPGKAVIIEQVSMPICDESYDWGGVAQEWWETAIDEYHWDVQPESIVHEKDSIFKNRYHVFMRKNPAR